MGWTRHRKPGNRSLTSRGPFVLVHRYKPGGGGGGKEEEEEKRIERGKSVGRTNRKGTTVTLISEHEVDEGLMTM